MQPEYSAYIGVKSNYSVIMYEFDQDKIFPIYESKICNILETKNNVGYSNHYSMIFFKSEENKYMSYSLETKQIKEISKVSKNRFYFILFYFLFRVLNLTKEYFTFL
jgi:hypothetical protein